MTGRTEVHRPSAGTQRPPRRWLATLLPLAALLVAAIPGRAVEPQFHERKMIVQPRVQPKAYPFALTDVRLLDGPFRHAMELDARYLLSLEPDRLLSRFREY